MTGKKRTLTTRVLIVGFVSFFNDIASDMTAPLIPVFLTTELGAPVAIIGLVMGLAEGLSNVFKLFFGWLSDKMQRRIPFIVTGYSFSAVSKALVGLARSWPLVLVARIADRLGKGIRTSARDAFLAEESTGGSRGLAFGFHRGMDSGGAFVGPLVSIVLLNFFGGRIRPLFFAALIPSLFGILLLVLLARKNHTHSQPSQLTQRSAPISWDDLAHLPRAFFIFLGISALFGLANSSESFIILKAMAAHFSLTSMLALHSLAHLIYSFLSIPLGLLSDRIGPRKVLLASYLVFTFTYIMCAYVSASRVWIIFPLYGLFLALSEGSTRIYIASITPHRWYGTAYGLYFLISGMCIFLASLVAGLIWTIISPIAAFMWGATLAALAAALFAYMA